MMKSTRDLFKEHSTTRIFLILKYHSCKSKTNGAWSIGFDPAEVNFNFTEANSWQYSMFAPQDISGLIQLYGGE